MIEAYLTFCYAIKIEDVSLLRDAVRKITIILQALSARNPKYAWKMLHQMHILDINAANSELRNTYIANALVNIQSLPFTFYEMDLLLEHQNGEFKQFRSYWGLFLEETDEMFKQHALSVDALIKIWKHISRVIAGRERSRRHLTKNVLFHIQSLADQLYCSWSIIAKGPEPWNIYFSKNPVPNLLKKVIKELHILVWEFN